MCQLSYPQRLEVWEAWTSCPLCVTGKGWDCHCRDTVCSNFTSYAVITALESQVPHSQTLGAAQGQCQTQSHSQSWGTQGHNCAIIDNCTSLYRHDLIPTKNKHSHITYSLEWHKVTLIQSVSNINTHKYLTQSQSHTHLDDTQSVVPYSSPLNVN